MCDRDHFDTIIGFDCDGFYRFPSIPYIVSIKGVLADEAKQEKGWIRWMLKLQARWEAQNVQQADLVIATSQYSKKVIVENYRVDPNKIFILPELIDVQSWEELLTISNRGQAPISATVLSVCRMYPRKNLGLLLQAWVQVREKDRNAQLRIVGTGQEYKRWRKLAEKLRLQDSVLFLGDRSHEELAEEYKNCDIFCLPSRQEGFGIVFLEAMVAGKPIVAACAAAVPEVVREGKEGFLVSPDDPAQLASALLELIQSPELRSRMGQSARLYVKKYDAIEVAKQFVGIKVIP